MIASVRRELALGALVFVATAALLGFTHRSQGHSRDEGYYFEAARRYEAWFVEAGRSIAHGRVLDPFREAAIDPHWSYNAEHPPLAKVSFALSHLLFFRGLGWLDEESAFRLPAWLFAGLLSVCLYRLARRWGAWSALVAPALFWAVPRHFFHAHQACFDVPIAAMWCWCLVEYAAWMETRQGAWRVGLSFGLALATKHNAFFLPLVFFLHWLVTERGALWEGGLRGLWMKLPRAWWTMALVGPLVLYVLWPWLWHHPIDRVNGWLSFHRHHVHYPWQYFGTVLRAPPFPIEYPLALEAVTLPVATLVVIVLGLVLLSRSLLRREDERYEWLLALGIVLQLVPFMTTVVPIFGGVKHWMPAVAVACVPAARFIVEACEAAWPSRRRLMTAVVSAFVLVPGAMATIHFHPFGTSAYSELAGGASGGAALGMQRQYWSNNVTSVLPWLAQNAPKNARVYFHEVNVESFRAYQNEGAIRRDLRYASSPADASIAIYQYHQEFRDREFEIWNDFGTRVPELSFAIDEATQIVVYRRRKG